MSRQHQSGPWFLPPAPLEANQTSQLPFIELIDERLPGLSHEIADRPFESGQAASF
jgi:hypothetical protein